MGATGMGAAVTSLFDFNGATGTACLTFETTSGTLGAGDGAGAGTGAIFAGVEGAGGGGGAETAPNFVAVVPAGGGGGGGIARVVDERLFAARLSRRRAGDESRGEDRGGGFADARRLGREVGEDAPP
jgi:hypothetical protein